MISSIPAYSAELHVSAMYHRFPIRFKTWCISSISQILGPSITFVNYTLLQTRLRPGFLFSKALGLNLKLWAWNGLKSETALFNNDQDQWGKANSGKWWPARMFKQIRAEKNPKGNEIFEKRHFMPDFCVRLKFQSSKYSIYSCGWNFRLPWTQT